MVNRIIIGRYSLNYDHCINVYEFNYFREYVLCGMNDEVPRWRRVRYSDDGRPYFVYVGSEIYFDEVLKVQS